MLFGGTVFVWGYNRIADMFTAIGAAWLIPLLHYVDDFGSIEDDGTVDSGFDAFESMAKLFGFKLKTSKRQTPEDEHVLQGQSFGINNDKAELTIAPTPHRRLKIEDLASGHLDKPVLRPSEAGSLAGKSGHFMSATEGQMGRAALKPLFARQHAVQRDYKITTAIKTSLRTLIFMAREAPPRVLPLALPTQGCALIYADAFITIEGQQRRARDISPEERIEAAAISSSGWGVVFVPEGGGKPSWAGGTFPPNFVRKFGGAMAFIYLLEAMAQFLGLLIFYKDLSSYYVSFCDNAAATAALAKGYGSDKAVNAITATFWAMAVLSKKTPHFERVPSKANISDGVSRGDMSLPDEFGWAQREMPKGVWKFLNNIDFEKVGAGVNLAKSLLKLSELM